jgi:hypothetical protein
MDDRYQDQFHQEYARLRAQKILSKTNDKQMLLSFKLISHLLVPHNLQN